MVYSSKARPMPSPRKLLIDCHLGNLENARLQASKAHVPICRSAGDRHEDVTAVLQDFANRIGKYLEVLLFDHEVLCNPLLIERAKVGFVAGLETTYFDVASGAAKTEGGGSRLKRRIQHGESTSPDRW